MGTKHVALRAPAVHSQERETLRQRLQERASASAPAPAISSNPCLAAAGASPNAPAACTQARGAGLVFNCSAVNLRASSVDPVVVRPDPERYSLGCL